MYGMKVGFEESLRKHLWKCELEYRAENLPNGSCVDWLWHMCGSTEEIATFLRELGFKIREIVDEVDCAGDPHQWVETTSGVIVWVNQHYLRGFVCCSARRKMQKKCDQQSSLKIKEETR